MFTYQHYNITIVSWVYFLTNDCLVTAKTSTSTTTASWLHMSAVGSNQPNNSYYHKHIQHIHSLERTAASHTQCGCFALFGDSSLSVLSTQRLLWGVPCWERTHAPGTWIHTEPLPAHVKGVPTQDTLSWLCLLQEQYTYTMESGLCIALCLYSVAKPCYSIYTM